MTQMVLYNDPDSLIQKKAEYDHLRKTNVKLLTVLRQAVPFVAAYTADRDSVIGQRMLDKMTVVIKETEI